MKNKKLELVGNEILSLISSEYMEIDNLEHPLKDKVLSVGYDGEPIIFEEGVDDGFSNEYVSKEDVYYIGVREGQWKALFIMDRIRKILYRHL